MDNYVEDVSAGKPYRDSLNVQIENWIALNQAQAEKKRTQRFERLFPEKQELLRAEFKDMLGFPLTDYDKLTPAEITEKTFISRCFGCNAYRIRYDVLPGISGYGILLSPTEKNYGKTPLVVACHGGSGTPEVVSGFVMDSANYNHMARRACQYGVSVFAPQLYMWNREIYGTSYDRQSVASALVQLGGSITAFEITLILRGIDALVACEEGLDENKIGFIGLSYGGMYSIAAAAVDVRIKSVLSSCWLNDRAKYNWSDWVYSGSAYKFFDAETAALIFPRALYVECGSADPTFTRQGAEREFEKLSGYYNLAGGAPLSFKIFDGVHELGKSQDGYEFFMRHLSADRRLF